jgi:hypothetical protein
MTLDEIDAITDALEFVERCADTPVLYDTIRPDEIDAITNALEFAEHCADTPVLYATIGPQINQLLRMDPGPCHSARWKAHMATHEVLKWCAVLSEDAKFPRAVAARISSAMINNLIVYTCHTSSAHRRDILARQAQLLAGITAPDWRLAPSWRTPDVVAIAQHIYDSRDFSGMPILADALEEADCDNREWLCRMRDPSWPWCRGCHIIDSLLPELAT